MGPAAAVSKELMSIPESGAGDDAPFARQRKVIAGFKKAILMTAGAAVQKLAAKLEGEQQILMNISDMSIQTFNSESALLRVMKLAARNGEANCEYELDIVNTYLYDAADKINKYGKDAINAFAGGDDQRMLLLGLKRFTKVDPFNSKAARERIAQKLIDKYPG
jgi:hypothetical protein